MSTNRRASGRLITAAELAADLDMSVRTINRRAQAGDLPYAYKMPGVRGAYLFDPGTVALWARQNGRILKAAS